MKNLTITGSLALTALTSQALAHPGADTVSHSAFHASPIAAASALVITAIAVAIWVRGRA